MNLANGMYRKHLADDIKVGSLVAYYVKDDDKNINNPIARCMLKPFYDHKNNMVLVADRPYGSAPRKFMDNIIKFLKEFNKSAPDGIYYLHDDLYDDGKNTVVVGEPDFDHLNTLDRSKQRSIVGTTENRNIIEWGFKKRIVGITANRNLTKKDFELALDFEKAENFATNCPYEDLVFQLEDTDEILMNFRGKITKDENIKIWLEGGGDSKRIGKKQYLAYINSLPVLRKNLNNFGMAVDDVNLQDIGYEDVPKLNDWIAIAKEDGFAISYILKNRFSPEVRKDLIEHCVKVKNNNVLLGFAKLVKDEKKYGIVRKCFWRRLSKV